ncbi:MAG: DUF4922 domain-containing protein [Muribaculaceae bacterium]|nr:DUF4922 domain-containing protein [Muribaculaceae bacterium]
MLLIEQIDELWERQLRNWQLVRDNYAALDGLLTREVIIPITDSLEDSHIILQYNPKRLRSSSASIDDASLKARPCFLCNENQPKEQETVVWDNRYKIQVNPYPIFSRHLTISALEHKPQRIAGRIGDMMRLAKELKDYVVFYNGPYSGASAPDHAHFQAGLYEELPICHELFSATTSLIDANKKGIFGTVTCLGRPVFYIESLDIEHGEQWFNDLIDALPVKKGQEEPMINILCWHDSGSWCIAVFPRRKHRPACYGTGEDQFVLSPASLDMGGLWAVAREEDFNNLTLHDVRLILMDVCLAPEDFEDITEKLHLIYSKR